MKEFLEFCKEYGLNKNDAKSLTIFNNFKKFKEQITKEIATIRLQTQLMFFCQV